MILQLLEKVFIFQKDAFYDIIKACGIWSQSVAIFHVSLSIIYLLFTYMEEHCFF